MVDLVGTLRIEIAQRVVRERGQVDHRIEAVQVRLPDVAQIHAPSGRLRRALTERAPLEQTIVQPDDRMVRATQHRRHHRADIALVTCQ